MAQKPFISDMGIRLGDWLLAQNPDGDLAAGHVAVDANNAQRAFRADHGVKIGNWEMYADGDELSVTENRVMAGSQRPFIADAGFQISSWTFSQDTNGNMLLSTTAIVSSGTISSGGTVTVPGDWSTSTLAYTLDNPNGSAGDRFGDAVAIDGDYAIVGSYVEGDAGGEVSGKAYIFNTSTGALVHTLDNPNAYGTSANDQFGNSVSISGNRAIVAAPYEDDASGTDSGKAYIFDVTTGALLHTLDNPNAYVTGKDDWFASAVSISGDRAIVGAWGEEDPGGVNSGRAYIFNVTTGALLYTLDNPNPYAASAYDLFGWSVAISGDRAIVGARGEDDAGGTFAGKAYIYDVTDGSLLYTLDNPTAYSTSSGDQFGWTVAISGNYAIVGAVYEDDASGTDSGKAYIYDVTTGNLLHTLDNPNAYSTSANDQFGNSVAISDTHAIVGAPYEDVSGNQSSGKAYIFDAATGNLVKTLDNPDAGPAEGTNFGFESISISGNHAIVGAWKAEKAYIFTASTETSGDTGGTEPAIEMDPSSPDFDHTNFNWAITTSYDVPNPPSGLNQTAYENGEYAQVPETDNSGTWTVTTDAPDGTQIYMYTTAGYLGTYDYPDDPSNSDFSGSVYGIKTVQNGQITENFGAYNDLIAENGELKKIRIKDKNTWTWGEYTKLAETQWLHFVDESNAWSPPQSGDSVLGGESYAAESGIYWTQWQTAADSATGNPQITLRVDESKMTNDRQTITYILDNIYGPGSWFFIEGYGFTVLTSTPTKTYSGQTFADYTFDLDHAPSSTQTLYGMRFYA